MKAIIDEFGKVMVYALISLTLIGLMYAVLNGELTTNANKQLEAVDTVKSESNADYTSKSRPTLEVKESIKLNVNDNFDVITTPAVTSKDGTTGASILSKVQIFGEISGVTYDGNWASNRSLKVTEIGVYTLRYSVRDSSGFYAEAKVKVIVEPNI